MDAILMLVIAIWVVINGFMAYKGFVFLRQQGIHAPEATNEDVARWVRGKENTDDMPEALLPALRELRGWRAFGRKYFWFAASLIVAILVLRMAGMA